jgi:hypothetical protein
VGKDVWLGTLQFYKHKSLGKEMDVSRLRTQLQFYYPHDFKNLTTSELKDCKWKIQISIFSVIIFSSNSLFLYSETLNNLNEKKLKTLENLRSRKDDLREFKKQTEEEYRHQFLQLILQICLEYNFPPATEPFSNPLQSFYEDKEFVLQVISFFLEVIVAPNSNTRPLQFLNSAVEPSTPMPSSAPVTPSKNFPVTEPKTTPRKSPISKSSRPATGRSVDETSQRDVDTTSSTSHTLGDYQSLFQSFQVNHYPISLTSHYPSRFCNIIINN